MLSARCRDAVPDLVHPFAGRGQIRVWPPSCREPAEDRERARQIGTACARLVGRLRVQALKSRKSLDLTW